MASNPFDQFDEISTRTVANPFDQFDQQSPPQRTLKTNLQDVAATAAKGITGLSDAAIGLANIPTMGQAGRSAQLVGLNEVYDDPMQAEQALQEHQQNIAAGKRNEFLDASPYSAPQQFAQKQVTDAEGVLGKLGAAVRNPSTIATAVGESVPSMLAGGLIGRGLAVGTKLSPVAAGAVGEGVVGAGAAAEQTRKESPTGTLTPQQTAMNLASGIGTGIFGYVGGKVANKLGFDDADTLIANGFQRVAKKSAAGGAEVAEKGFAQNAAEVAGRIVGGGISEGAFEELPQTIQETMWQNAATGKPLTEGMDEAAVMGFLSGVAMGGPVNALPRPTQTSPEQTQTAPAPGPISRAADMLARTTPGIMGKVMDPAIAPLPEDNLAGEWNAQEQQAMAGNQARNFTRAEQAAYDLEQQRQAQQAEARRKADPLAAQKAAFEESYNAMGTVPESTGNITPDDAAAFERKVEFERATNRRQQYIKAWKQAEQEADTLTRDPEIPAEVKREARKQVREIVKADPVYEQMNEVKRRGGLNLEAMGQDYDRDTVNIINRRYPGIFSRVGSVKPDDFANEMGYDNLDAMVRRFSEARTQKELTASILKEKTGDWQNAESEQQAYAAKQAERKQGAEWAGAQGADSVSRGVPARTVFPAPDEAVSAMESMIRRKPENFKEEDFDHWTYTAEQQGRLKQAYREAVNGAADGQFPGAQATVRETDAQREPRDVGQVTRAAAPAPAEVLPRTVGATQPAQIANDAGEFLRDQGIRRDAVGKVSEPMRRQPGESTREFIKRRKAGKDRRISRNPNNEPQADLSPTSETQTRTDSFTNRIATVADQQSNQDVIVDKTIDKIADKSAAENPAQTHPRSENATVQDSRTGAESEQEDKFANNKVFTADKVEAARARLKAKRGSLSSGFDPELMQDMLIIGGAHFESGIRKFSAWSKAVMADIGEEFKPFLRGTYENLRHYPGIDKEGMSTAAEIDGLDLDAIGKQADNAGKEQSQPAAETNKEATDVQANSPSIPEAEQSGRTEPSPNRGEGIGVPADAGAELSGTGRPDRQADDGRPARRSDRTGKGAQYGADDRKGGVDERHGGISEQPVASSSSPQNYRITEADRLGKGGAKQKARDNIKAIRILKQLSQESRPATTDEQAQLVKYVGWGASELANGIFPQKKYEPASRRYVDSYKDDWKTIGEELRASLTDEEYNAAKASTINAHYTSEKIIKGMYAALERFGYTGKGKALEPGSGVGHFIGLLPDAFTAGTRFTTVEMDPISAGIAKALYPGHDVRQADFTKFKAPDNFFDLAIGNPPFSDIEIVSDHDYAEKKFKLHDYFFAKSIDKVRPGGLMVLVTSRYTMDKGNDKARSYLAKRADLLGAIRLPQTAFKENAGTEVVTDVLFLRKRIEGERPAGQAWGRLEPVQAGGKEIHVNEYFSAHPEMVLGKHSTAGSMYGPGQYTVEPNKGDIAEQFAQAVTNLPENVYQADKSAPAPTDSQTIEAEWSPQSVKEGAFYLNSKGELLQKENGIGSPVVGMGKKKAVIKDFVRIRDAVRQVLYVQLKDEGDLAVAQQELGDAYDAFVAAHGPINKTTEVATTNKATGKESVSYRYPNFSHFKADPDAYLIAAIEKYDDSTHKAEKTDIFTKRVISPPAEPRVESLVDALHVSLHQTGEVDVPLIAKMMGVDEDTAIDGLSGAIYLDPNGNRWVTADEYLSGNVRRKLAAALAAADIEPKYTANVTALEAVQPQDLPPSRIKVSLGMPIIQAEDVESFAAEVMQMGIAVRHIAATGTWDVTKRSGWQTLVATNDYGTNRLDAADLIDAALNNRTVKVYDRDSDGKQVFNRDATEAAFAKLQKIRERFSQWAWEDAGRSTLLARKFNDLYNNTVKREYGGDHIKQMRFPGMSAVITPHEHQKRVAWRIVQRGNTYMAHSVGAGKTIGSIIAGMELKRLGIKKKPMWVVPNHMLKQFSSEFQQLYPAAKLLVADEEQFAKGNRNRFMGRIAAENWDGIIITHSAFGKIPVSEDYQSEFIGEQIAELEDMMADADGDRTKTKQLERQKKRLEQRLERILNNASKDKGVSFEESGIDQLFVDEAHQFRKLDFVTNQTSISGIDPNGSLMAFDLYVKTRYLETLYPGRSMVMMSGTPVTNTIGEVYTIQRFLSEPALRELDIHNFDAWAATFGESVTELVATPAGTYQPKTRFGRFRNMPSLAGMWGEIGDFVHAKDLPYLKRPMVDGGGRKMIIGQSSDIQKAYKQSLAARIKAIKERKGPPQKGDDILLTVITDGRHAALDERFIAPEANPRKDAKLEMLVDKVHGIWTESAEKRSTQMIFADLGLPQAEATRGFSVYKHIKQELMRRGVPEAEIAFMQDYKKSDEKQKLFKAMNNGDVRVLIGSSAAMGTGVNAQRKLVALHHFDPDTYLPSNIEQREGRIVRQGNENEQVQLYVYLTRGSYDETMWQFIESKQRFIDQFLAGSVAEDTVEDIDGAANQYAEARAMSSDNPLVLELAGLENDISKLESLRRAHVDGQVRMARDRSAWKSRIGTIEKLIPMVEAAAKARVDTKGERFAMTVLGKDYKGRADAGEKLIGLLKSQAARPVMVEAHDIGEIAGFTLKARSNTLDHRDMVFTLWHGKTELQGKVEDRYNKIAIENGLEKEPSPSGLVMRLENLARGVDERLEDLKDELAKAEHVIKEADNRMGAKFEQLDALEDKRARADEIRVQLELEGSESQDSTGPGEQEVKLSKSTSSITPSSSSPSDIRAEVAAKLGRFRTMQLMRRGVLNVVATQDEAEADIQNKEDAFRSEQTGAIQGYVKDGKVKLVADGIPSGNAYQVFLHEITHATRLGLNSNAQFRRLLDTIERHKGQDTALGKAIDAAEARIPADTKPEHRTEETLSYLIEDDRTDVGVVRRFIAMVKKVLVNMGVSPDIFSKEDFKALAVNAAKWQSTMATGGNVMRSVGEMFKPVDPNSPALKRWQGNSQMTEPVFHGSPKEFWTFDKNSVGKNTTSPGAGLGFFFATNRAESQGYAGPSGSLRSFYVKAENPKYMNASDLPKFRGVDEAQAYAKRQQLAGYDSIVLEDEGHVIVFEPNQVKSAEINTGAFDAGNDDVRYSVAGGGSGITGNGPGPVWATPQDSKTDSFIYNAQDKLIDMKRIQDNIEKVLGPIQEQHDVRMAEELYHKRAAKRVEDVLVSEVNPLMKELGSIPSADLSEFEEYMHALHAPEANESLRQRNPNEQELKALKEAAKADRDNLQQSAIVRRFIDKERELAAAERDVEAGDADDSLIAVINDELESLRDDPIVGKYIKAREKHRKIRHAQPFGGDNTALSGMSNEAAESLLSNMPAAKLRKYKVLAAKWRRFMDKTRDTLVQYELESQETVDSWAEAFENYVPLHREDMENGMGIGQGFSVKGSATRSRTGSNRKVVDIIAHIVAQRERAIVRGEKAAISRALYGLAAANPNPDVWTIETPPVMREFDPVTGLVVSRPDPMYKNKPNAVVHRFIDEKGHVEERSVLFNEQSERGMRLAQALKNLDAEQLGAILRTSAVLTRWFSAINTQYNLVFGPVNAIRDAGSAMLHLTDTPLAGRQAQVAKRIATGIKPLFKAIWAEASGTPLNTDIAKAWHELQIEGGTTGFRDMFENAEERAEELKRAMLSTTKSRIAAKLSWAKQQVSQYNDVMENCTRLAVYMESRDQGLSKAKSASLAKNITLNFNRKGKVASQAGAMYAFFNASMQGTEKMYRTMTGPAGKKILAGGLLLGASQAVLLAAAGFGDNEPPEFIKERALIIPVGGKKYVSIPMPLGFNIIPNVARVATEWMLSGGKDTGERVTGLIGSFAETFNPIGNAGFSVQTIAPTVIDPLVALSENKDWTGKPIAKQNFNTLKPTPGHERMKDTASAVGIGLSRLLNFLSGGTEYTPGSLSPTPDQIDYLIGQAFGGVGRESLKAAQVVGTMYTGEDLPVYKIPLVSRFYGDSADSSAASTAFYRNVKRMNVHAAEIEGLAENRGDVAGYMADHPEAKYVRRTEATYRRVQKLQKAKRTLLKNDAPRAKVEAVEKSISSLMAAYNMVVEER